MVEDNRGDVILVEEALRANRIRFELEVYADGDAAVRGLTRRKGEAKSLLPQLILLDWNLPTIGGAEVLSTIRAFPGWSELPIAVLTSSSSPRDREDAARLGATRYIQKPMGLVEFIDGVGQGIRELVGPDFVDA